MRVCDICGAKATNHAVVLIRVWKWSMAEEDEGEECYTALDLCDDCDMDIHAHVLEMRKNIGKA